MSKIMKNFIFIGFILVVASMVIVPGSAAAEGGRNYVFGEFTSNYGPTVPRDSQDYTNPKPIIRWISPKSGNRGAGPEAITITGTGFVPSSVAKVNGLDRPTTYIDSTRLLMQVNLNEPYRTENGFYVTVWNGAPGGGHSNSAFFKLEGADPALTRNSYQYAYDYPYGYNPNVYGETDTRNTSLASSVILGDSSFLPSSLVQWVFTAILIIAIIILARKVFGHREEYDNTPLKHA